MNNVRTVSDTKRAFYTIHTRPINSIYRRVVEELMVEMHLLRVNEDFRYDPIFALGVVTSFDRFMQGYRPEQDKISIFNAICRAQESDPGQYQQDAKRLQELVTPKSIDELMIWLAQAVSDGGDELQSQLQAIATNPKFKYNRLFAIGLFTLLELADSDLVKDEARLTEVLQQICKSMNLPETKLQKDLELYRSNLEKMIQARKTLEDIQAADRKRRQQAASAKDGLDSLSTSTDSQSAAETSN